MFSMLVHMRNKLRRKAGDSNILGYFMTSEVNTDRPFGGIRMVSFDTCNHLPSTLCNTLEE